MIRAFANYKKGNWVEHLVDSEVAHNSSVNSKTLYSSFFIKYGIHAKLIPLGLLPNNLTAKSFIETIHDTTKFAYDRIVKQNKKMAQYANNSKIPHSFKVGDKVWVSRKSLCIEDGNGIRKQHPKFREPFEISERIRNITFRLK